MTDEKNTDLKNLPGLPGVYQFYNSEGKLLYIGKAKNLKKRVSSYFNKNHNNAKTRILVSQIHRIDHLVVESESDALLLENNLVKKHQPKYNVMLKDDKTFPWICVTDEPFPRVFKTRTVQKGKDQYFGPYTSVPMVNAILDFITQVYKTRSCTLNLTKENIDKKKFKVCLEYHIGNCKAPCIGLQTEPDYDSQIDQIRNILKGHVGAVLETLKEKMKRLAAELKFEEAQEIKEKIEKIQHYRSKSAIVSSSIENVDVFSFTRDESTAYVNFLKVVNGSVIQAHAVEMKLGIDESDEDLLLFAIAEIRERTFSNAAEIIVPFELSPALSGAKFHVPKMGDKKKLLDLSMRNVLYYKADKRKKAETTEKIPPVTRKLERIKSDLRLKELPVLMECFDNSNIQGTNPVASCVVFKNAAPAKREYRHFNVKSVDGPDDFASMEEIVFRRYRRKLDENEPLPQLIIIDGGKGQLGAAVKILDELGLMGKVAVIGIAKKLEEIYFPNDQIPVYLDKKSETLRIIQQIRNEAHRFAITFHRNKRSSEFTTSELEKIAGIGEKTAELLLKKFRSVRNISAATLEQIAEISGKKKAQIIKDYFEKQRDKQ